MVEKLAQPDRHLVRAEAATAVEALDALAKSYADRGVDLRKRALDPVQGAHANLSVISKIATATEPYLTLTGEKFVLEDTPLRAPIMAIHSGSEGRGEVAIFTANRRVLPVTHQRIDRIHTLNTTKGRVPKRALLISRLGRRAPQDYFERIRRNVLKASRRSRLSSVGFHIFGN